jgi:hypothetical protein
MDHLHPIAAHIARAGVGIARDDQRQTDEPPGILRPTLLDRHRGKIRRWLDNFLARP